MGVMAYGSSRFKSPSEQFFAFQVTPHACSMRGDLKRQELFANSHEPQLPVTAIYPWPGAPHTNLT